jgi:hypothetical protein
LANPLIAVQDGGMTVIVELRPETEAGLAARAAEQGVSLAQYVRRLLEEQVGSDHTTLSPAARASAWRESAKGLPHTPPLSDEAVSRESMYDTRG